MQMHKLLTAAGVAMMFLGVVGSIYLNNSSMAFAGCFMGIVLLSAAGIAKVG